MSIFKKAEPKPFEIKDRQLVCPFCKSETFWSRRAQLNTSVASFFGVDWANRSATCFVCSECTHIQWFLG